MADVDRVVDQRPDRGAAPGTLVPLGLDPLIIEVPPKMSVSRFMGILKGKSALMIFDRFANLKYKYGNRHFWCRGYFVDTVGRNKTAIQKYIQNQLVEDKTMEQMSLKEYIDPFTGKPTEEGK